MNRFIIGILLAAGKSARMGRAKQLLDINGEPLVVHTAKKLLAVAPDFELLVVLGARAGAIQPVLQDLPAEIVFNKNYEKGMGTSLVAALRLLQQRELHPAAILLSVCDQPYLSTELLQTLVAKHHEFPTRIITARYGDTFGVPAILPAKFFPELRQLTADQGAKKVMHHHATELVFVDFPRGDFDLDTPADYSTFRQ